MEQHDLQHLHPQEVEQAELSRAGVHQRWQVTVEQPGDEVLDDRHQVLGRYGRGVVSGGVVSGGVVSGGVEDTVVVVPGGS
ncbi:hypothetical protein SDC9_175195 [bioreactor metagenome]|uniref:Uncharacterized protein n=1 Tax=bioreactor metagenome TaxID=1076179 RepID=A0A645GLD6_9ZZZZ